MKKWADMGLFTKIMIGFVIGIITGLVLGPKALGIKTVWIDRNGIGGRYGQDYTVSSLEELFPICGL